MIMITNFITISFKMLKNSTISLACSPIFPMAMPKAMKNPIRPVGESHHTGQVIKYVFLLLVLYHSQHRSHILAACYSVS